MLIKTQSPGKSAFVPAAGAERDKGACGSDGKGETGNGGLRKRRRRFAFLTEAAVKNLPGDNFLSIQRRRFMVKRQSVMNNCVVDIIGDFIIFS